jgi:hypothetical protein
MESKLNSNRENIKIENYNVNKKIDNSLKLSPFEREELIKRFKNVQEY